LRLGALHSDCNAASGQDTSSLFTTMFTGLVEALGTVKDVTPVGAGHHLVLSAPTIAAQLALGDSVAINGTCLTVVQHDAETCRFEIGPETLLRTNLGMLRVHDHVNLERSLRLGDRVGGHMVQGHVDGVGRIVRRLHEGEWVTMEFTCPPELTTQMIPKGSIAVDGISLTLVEVTRDGFSIMLIPHTLANTTLGFKQPGDAVNLETDMMAKYVKKYLDALKLP
jgi:riboflavin synthase